MSSEVVSEVCTKYTGVPSGLLVHSPIQSTQAVAWSHVDEPIIKNKNSINGRSRAWGDISLESQSVVVEELLEAACNAGFTLKETSFLLALVRVESGFNPDAAASTSSAAGLGQFIDATGSAYGLTAKNRFSVKDSIQALVEHVKDSLHRASKQAVRDWRNQFAYAYAYHHDGPSLAYGGLEIARSRVIPWMERFLGWLYGH